MKKSSLLLVLAVVRRREFLVGTNQPCHAGWPRDGRARGGGAQCRRFRSLRRDRREADHQNQRAGQLGRPVSDSRALQLHDYRRWIQIGGTQGHRAADFGQQADRFAARSRLHHHRTHGHRGSAADRYHGSHLRHRHLAGPDPRDAVAVRACSPSWPRCRRACFSRIRTTTPRTCGRTTRPRRSPWMAAATTPAPTISNSTACRT